MSVVKQLYLHCEGRHCEDFFTGEPSDKLGAVRKEARKTRAWSHKDDKDYCELHSQAAATNDQWENNEVQFPRLLDEIAAIGLTSYQVEIIEKSMDLTRSQIDELFERATSVWDGIKEEHRDYLLRCGRGIKGKRKNEQQDEEDNRQGSEEVRSSEVS